MDENKESRSYYEFKQVDPAGCTTIKAFTCSEDSPWGSAPGLTHSTDTPFYKFVEFLNGCGYIINPEEFTYTDISYKEGDGQGESDGDV